VKLRVHLSVSDPAVRKRLVAVLRSDGDVVLVGSAEEADVIVGDSAVRTAAASDPESPEELVLTSRELSVLRLVAHGLGNKEIAAELGISSHTVKYHLASVLAKLGVRSRTEAVTLGLRKGLVPL